MSPMLTKKKPQPHVCTARIAVQSCKRHFGNLLEIAFSLRSF